jgi:hypothetical protein
LGINRWLNEHNIDKKLFYKWHTQFWYYKGVGATFTGNYISLVQSVGNWGMILAVLFKFDLSKTGKWLILFIILNITLDLLAGWLKLKYKLVEYENNYLAKQKNISPFNAELRQTLESIAEKTGAKNYFTEL